MATRSNFWAQNCRISQHLTLLGPRYVSLVRLATGDLLILRVLFHHFFFDTVLTWKTMWVFSSENEKSQFQWMSFLCASWGSRHHRSPVPRDDFFMVRWWNVDVVQTVWWLWCNVRYTVTQIYTDDRYSIVLHRLISVCFSHWEPGKQPDEPSGMNLIHANEPGMMWTVVPPRIWPRLTRYQITESPAVTNHAVALPSALNLVQNGMRSPKKPAGQ